MLEGLAVWALFIYLLRLVGMPWNKFTQGFAYLGGASWLLFVWIGLINYTPMDLSGGSLVQSPHIQLRPASNEIKGNVERIYVKPNQRLEKGQLVYELESETYQIALNKASVQLTAAEVALSVAKEDVRIAKAQHLAYEKDIEITNNQLASTKEDLSWKTKTLKRYQEQNRVVAHTVTESQLDEQSTAVEVAKTQLTTLQSQVDKARLTADKALLAVEKAELEIQSKQADVANAQEAVAQAEWNLAQTKVYAPTNGYLTNYIMREGQYVGLLPRIQMYTDEKYVLMRVNHQAIRNVKVGQRAEFTSAVYPGKIFSAEVEGIVEATGEAQGSLLALETPVRATTGNNVMNKHHFVRLKLLEPEGYDIPVGSVGLAWISGEKPIAFMSFLDVIRGIIIRMKSQIYFFYSM